MLDRDLEIIKHILMWEQEILVVSRLKSTSQSIVETW